MTPEKVSLKEAKTELPGAITKYTVDLIQLAREKKLKPVIGRDKEISRMIQILGRQDKNNPVLIGEAGVGKTVIVEGLAQLIASGKVPTLQNKQILRVDLPVMVAGTKYRGEFEERITDFLSGVEGRDDVIIFIDELHTIVGAGAAEGAMDASNILKPALARGKLHCIGATTPDEYRKHIEKDPALERRFQSVLVEEPSVETAIEILKGLRQGYEEFHRVKILDNSLEAAVKLSTRYISDRYLPDKAVDLIDEACSAVRIKGGSTITEYNQVLRQIVHLSIDKSGNPQIANQLIELRKRAAFLRQQQKETEEPKATLEKLKEKLREAEANKDVRRITHLTYVLIPQKERELSEIRAKIPSQVTANDIAEIVFCCTGIPVSRLLSSEKERLAHLEDELNKRIIGQDHAVGIVSKAIRRQRTGLADPKRPIGVFLFVGSTGVGKTELSKALAEVMFDDEDAMTRIDCSEYQERHAVSKLIGAPPGYVGYGEPGQLTEAVKRKPYSVVLLDEIEKAHPDFFNVLLQMMDDGRLTDSEGRTINFRNTIIIMTSNLGAEVFQQIEEYSAQEEKILKLVKSGQIFRREFVNRIDEIAVFRSLSKDDIKEIVKLQIDKEKKLMAELELGLELTPAALAHLAEISFDSQSGAREVSRAIRREIKDRISSQINEGKIKPGQKVSVDFQIDPKDQKYKIQIKVKPAV